MRGSIKTAGFTMLVNAKPSKDVEALLDEYCEARDARLLREPEIVDSDESSHELHLGLVTG